MREEGSKKSFKHQKIGLNVKYLLNDKKKHEFDFTARTTEDNIINQPVKFRVPNARMESVAIMKSIVLTRESVRTFRCIRFYFTRSLKILLLRVVFLSTAFTLHHRDLKHTYTERRKKMYLLYALFFYF